jgi:hypothetical protein
MIAALVLIDLEQQGRWIFCDVEKTHQALSGAFVGHPMGFAITISKAQCEEACQHSNSCQ